MKKDIEAIALTDGQKQELISLIEIAEKSNKAKKSGLVKTALKEIWDFAKSIRSSMLVAYMSMKFGLS